MIGLLGVLSLPNWSCNGATPPDEYLGTIDGSGFDPTFGTDPKNTGPACIAPRPGYAANGFDQVS